MIKNTCDFVGSENCYSLCACRHGLACVQGVYTYYINPCKRGHLNVAYIDDGIFTTEKIRRLKDWHVNEESP